MMRIFDVLWVWGGLASCAFSAPIESKSIVEKCQSPIKAQLTQIENPSMDLEKTVELVRLSFYLGRCAFEENEMDEAVKFFEKGLEIAENALETQTTSHWPLVFWWGANKGSIADIKRNLGALKTIKTVEEKMLQMREENPDYGFSGPNRVLGKIYHKAPRFISIGSTSKAEEALKLAYQKFPQFPGNAISLAEFYAEEGKLEEVKKIIAPFLSGDLIEKGDFGMFNAEKTGWLKTVKTLEKKLGDTK